MATIKSFSDLEQSKKLAEILPLESADMCYILHASSDNPDWRFDNDIPPMVLRKISINELTVKALPCWSLSALLSVLPYPFLSELSNGIWKCGCYPSGICNYVTADSPINAYYELVLKLHELKML